MLYAAVAGANITLWSNHAVMKKFFFLRDFPEMVLWLRSHLLIQETQSLMPGAGGFAY